MSTAWVYNFLLFAVVIYAAFIESTTSDFYYQSVQEDEYVEWASFWAFLAAGGVFVLAAMRQRSATGKLPWFLVGVALFCVFVALEEISWGQRVVAYRPPVYFLEHNFQQELNIHNVVRSSLRKLALKGVILGYGVLLPLISMVPAMARRLSQLAVTGAPIALAPSFLATFILYSWYPWSFSGEWVELMLGLGFFLSALFCVDAYGSSRRPFFGSRHPIVVLILGWTLVVGLGFLTAASSRHLRGTHPDNVEAARSETQALVRDFLEQKQLPKCGLHKRLYTYKEEYDKPFLLRGTFSRLTRQGLPKARADFLLDPWNSPYWLRSRCRDSRVSVFVYSFGPNRRRDSTRWEIVEDDVGGYINRQTVRRRVSSEWGLTGRSSIEPPTSRAPK